MQACTTCGATAPGEALFCPQCGTRLDGAAAPPTHRHVFGIPPPGLLLGLCVAVLAVAVISFVAGQLLAGVVLLALAVALCAVLASTLRRVDGRLTRIAAGVRDETRGRAGFAWVSLASWSKAGREAMRLRSLQIRLQREQSYLIRALGEAVYLGDEDRAAALKLEAVERGERIEACGRELQSALKAARTRVSSERATIQATQVLAGDQGHAGDSSE